MPDPYDVELSLKVVIRLLRRCKEELSGLKLAGLDEDIDIALEDATNELCDLQPALIEANREEEAEDEASWRYDRL